MRNGSRSTSPPQPRSSLQPLSGRRPYTHRTPRSHLCRHLRLTQPTVRPPLLLLLLPQAHCPTCAAHHSALDEPAPPFPVHLRVGILTVSDRAAAGQYADESGPEVRRHVEQHAVLANWTVDFTRRAVVPDEAPDIQATLTDWSSPHSGPDGLKAALCNVILTTGGTGFAPRDVTPEATRAVLEKLAPGLMTAVLLETMEHEPLAVLSRAVAGVRHRTLIVNLPGRPRAVAQTLKILLPFLGHAVAQVDPPATDPP